jgi:periplasmic copper chaperone A
MVRCLVWLLFAAAIVPPAAAHSHKMKSLEIVHPWTPETVQKETTTARVFMTIKNSGRIPDRLISASTPRAEKVELVAGEERAGDSRSTSPFSIASGKTLVLHAKGQHLVLTGVKKAFHAYDDFKMTLVFEKTGRIVVDVVVEEMEEADREHRH